MILKPEGPSLDVAGATERQVKARWGLKKARAPLGECLRVADIATPGRRYGPARAVEGDVMCTPRGGKGPA